MKNALRNGTYADLNIYLQTNLSSPSTAGSNTSTLLLGYCTLPATWVTTSTPRSSYVQDGCNVLAGSVPGGNVYGYNQGLTAVHEVGHWFGLLHVFQDYSCDPNDAGDMIDDTPQQSTATTGCPKGKDSCPTDPGLDAINNYMDYSTDAWSVFFRSSSFLRLVAPWGFGGGGMTGLMIGDIVIRISRRCRIRGCIASLAHIGRGSEVGEGTKGGRG